MCLHWQGGGGGGPGGRPPRPRPAEDEGVEAVTDRACHRCGLHLLPQPQVDTKYLRAYPDRQGRKRPSLASLDT